jgi:hypothetical protein
MGVMELLITGVASCAIQELYTHRFKNLSDDEKTKIHSCVFVGMIVLYFLHFYYEDYLSAHVNAHLSNFFLVMLGVVMKIFSGFFTAVKNIPIFKHRGIATVLLFGAAILVVFIFSPNHAIFSEVINGLGAVLSGVSLFWLQLKTDGKEWIVTRSKDIPVYVFFLFCGLDVFYGSGFLCPSLYFICVQVYDSFFPRVPHLDNILLPVGSPWSAIVSRRMYSDVYAKGDFIGCIWHGWLLLVSCCVVGEYLRCFVGFLKAEESSPWRFIYGVVMMLFVVIFF